jgi:hypothetical protein
MARSGMVTPRCGRKSTARVSSGFVAKPADESLHGVPFQRPLRGGRAAGVLVWLETFGMMLATKKTGVHPNHDGVVVKKRITTTVRRPSSAVIVADGGSRRGHRVSVTSCVVNK